ncbi:hypothetical protein PIROE2DRAFT_7896 [Piromyces sp. E2]|nr:hypothetical protein PIROE2DRAFT_7896 [Piromyces sp. E2]|eukprot:OUM65171.1 hypothetical protein PIROE2DRAFT_7896 [Piromyces sp. E2]
MIFAAKAKYKNIIKLNEIQMKCSSIKCIKQINNIYKKMNRPLIKENTILHEKRISGPSITKICDYKHEDVYTAIKI